MVGLLFYLLFFACFSFTIVHCLSFDTFVCTCGCVCVCVCGYECLSVQCVCACLRVCVVCARFAIESQQPHEPLVFVYSPLLAFPGPKLILFPLSPVWRLGMGQHECCMHNERIDVKLKTARTHRAPAGVGAQ